MKSLHISEGLNLPLEAVTQTFAILAKRGVGKTYTASVMVEEMLEAKLQVVVIDPIGVWWGLRASADGKSEGLPIIIAGGDHADIPITPTSGQKLAEIIVDDRMSMVIDLSLFRKGEQIKFMTDFAETLYHRNRAAMHLVLDEADAYAPQRPMPGEHRLLGAIEDIVRRGRARGIGVTMITQRPSVLNKNVLTQIEVLVALRLTAPIDQKAIDEWVKTHAEENQRAEFMGSLPSLPVGTAWFWSPGWLDLFQKVKVRTRKTLDSSSTPKVGEQRIEATKVAEVDLGKLRELLSENTVKDNSNDPKVLRAEIVKLRKELEHPKVEVRQVIPVYFLAGLQSILRHASTLLVEVDTALNNPEGYKPPTGQIAEAWFDDIETPTKNLKDQARKESDRSELHALDMVANKKIEPNMPEVSGLTNYEQGILDVFILRWPMQLTRAQLAVLSGRKPRSSAFAGAIKALVSMGIIRKDEGRYELTNHGQKVAGVSKKAGKQDLDEIIAMWREALPPYELRLFDKLLEHPQGITREDLAMATDSSFTSSGFHGAIKSLVQNGLAEREGEMVRLDGLFFNEIKE